jgi:hypothetical protein
VCLNNKYTKLLSVKIIHRIDKIAIPSILPNKECIFNKREGLPIKISVESLLIVNIQCSHKINHVIRFPIESLIEWKIVNGIKDGAFKHGYGLSTKYSDTDNENCVIYYPHIKGTKDDYKDKEIPISIRIRSNKIKESNKNFSAPDSYGNKSTLVMEDNANLLLLLHLKQKKGFFNKMNYECSTTFKPTSQKELENPSDQIFITDKTHTHTDFTNSFDENKMTFCIEEKCSCKCNECKLSITFKSSQMCSDTNRRRMNTNSNRLLSSEHIKISNSISENVYSENRSAIELEIKNNDKIIDNFRINNCPVIKIKETSWTSNAGSFPSGSYGNSVVYYSLKEKELSKSPIILTLYERNFIFRMVKNLFILLMKKGFGF